MGKLILKDGTEINNVIDVKPSEIIISNESSNINEILDSILSDNNLDNFKFVREDSQEYETVDIYDNMKVIGYEVQLQNNMIRIQISKIDPTVALLNKVIEQQKIYEDAIAELAEIVSSIE